MLRRLYVHNFRTLVNFTIEFNTMNLLLGSNGAGKSTVLEVLYRLKLFLVGDGRRLDLNFKPEYVTRWDAAGDSHQRFELEWHIKDRVYVYKLQIEYIHSKREGRVGAEELLCDGSPIYQYDSSDEMGTLYKEDDSSAGKFLSTPYSSGVRGFDNVKWNTKLVDFLFAVRSLSVQKIDLPAVRSEAQSEVEWPEYNMKDFASWYRHLVQSQPSRVFNLTSALRDILPGFVSMSLQTAGESKVLNVEFAQERGESISYRFKELSDGQKTLILLYTLLYCFPQENGRVLCIDEPENFLALPEIQAWLDALDRQVEDGRVQAVLISHHPRLINMMAGDCGQWFYRDGASSPTRTKAVTLDAADGLSAAKLVEMGWLVYD